jgi:hypothetical protein
MHIEDSVNWNGKAEKSRKGDRLSKRGYVGGVLFRAAQKGSMIRPQGV